VGSARGRREWGGAAYALAVGIVKPALLLFTKHSWSGGEHVPREGGAVLVANHASHIDPLTFAHFVHEQGRVPRYLAKAALFDVFFVGWVLRSSGQIPVHRLSSDASVAFDSAVAAVRDGKLVVVYPEGTLTRDPDLWPMVGKTGAARIALSAGVPVIPAAQWGAHEILYPYSTRPRLWPRSLIRVAAGPPVDLDEYRDQPLTPDTLRAATSKIMDVITTQLEEIRHEKAPPTRFDPRRAGVREIGNPHPKQRRAASRKRTR
jgi:1-acyl-sn-glycerol-3-phosphate acyltransferase